MAKYVLGVALLGALSACGDKGSSNDESNDEGTGSPNTSSSGDSLDGAEFPDGGDAEEDAGGSTGGTDTGADDGFDSGSSDDGTTDAMCDPKAQDCAEGEKCTFYRDEANPTGSNKCVPVTGAAQDGDACTRELDDTDSCDVGLLCWGTEPDNTTGRCVEFCDPELQCSSGDPCTVTNDGALPMCLPKCDPLAAECAPGWACYDDWFSDDWFCDRDKSGEIGAHGDPCSVIAGCDPGLICIGAEFVDSAACLESGSSACCSNVCDTSDQEQVCTGLETCTSYYELYLIGSGPPPEYATVGVCAVPAAE